MEFESALTSKIGAYHKPDLFEYASWRAVNELV